MNAFKYSRSFFLLAGCAAFFSGFTSSSLHALTLSQTPWSASPAATVKPNAMFLLDNSGSMAWSFVPDQALDSATSTRVNWASGTTYRFCIANSVANPLYYDPNYTYTPPVTTAGVTGTLMPNASFTAAWLDGFRTSYGTVNLSTNNYGVDWDVDMPFAYDQSNLGGTGTHGWQPAFYYAYTSGAPATPAAGVCYPNTSYTKVMIGASAADRQNFANWFSYYRTRVQTMKTAAGGAFAALDANTRVGFMSLNSVTATTSSTSGGYLNLADFDAAGKLAWYTKFYKIIPSGSTPLRTALVRSGKIFANKSPGFTPGSTTIQDPMQYSCQRNFTILTTDGLWNSDSDSAAAKLNGTPVGGQDNAGGVALPYGESTTIANSCPSVGSCNGNSDRTGTKPYSYNNNLSDIAYYYANTDIRTPALGNCTGALGYDVCANNVATGKLGVKTQRMEVFTLGLGVSGNLTYQSNYETATSGDFFDIKAGTKTWPQIKPDTLSTVDDLWHAGVNGGGTYFSASNPAALSTALQTALLQIAAVTGASSAAAVNNTTLTTTGNYQFSSDYYTGDWSGNLFSQPLVPSTGAIQKSGSVELYNWCVQDVIVSNVTLCTASATTGLKAKIAANSDTRKIYTFSAGGGLNVTGDNLRNFSTAGITAGEKTSYFNTSTLSQYSGLSGTQKSNATADTLINYLRGQTGYQINTTNAVANQVYRDRPRPLGDLVNSVPAYVAAPKAGYVDPGYAAYKLAQAGRAPMLYVGGNDGMFHAFDATTGEEKWAYIPSQVFPNLYRLADSTYNSNHRYFVDGSPAVYDLCTANCSTASATWMTILIAGFGNGAQGYFAFDITNPTTPKALWEINSSSLSTVGYASLQPNVVKLSNGEWVALLTSGYNNSPNSGYLYVVNPVTGVVRATINPAGSAGLNRIAAEVANQQSDATLQRAYAGDLNGNVWRFDVSVSGSTVIGTSTKIAVLKDSGGTAQPVTTSPQLALINGTTHVVYVGTGSLLQTSDLTSTAQQSIYAIKDALGTPPVINPRAGSMVAQSINNAVPSARTVSGNAVNWTTDNGWYVDLPDTGERVAPVDMLLAFSTLFVATNIPDGAVASIATAACTVGGGYGYLMGFDPLSGGGTLVSTKYSAGIAGIYAGYTSLGRGYIGVRRTDATSDTFGSFPPGGTANGAFLGVRTSWRELIAP